MSLLSLGLLFCVWYAFGASANVYCKLYLAADGSALHLTLVQYLVGCVCTSSLLLFHGTTFALPRPKEARLLFFVGLTNGIGHLMTNASMRAVAVSFTHTVKAAEPLFSVALSILLLGSRLSSSMLLSLLVIVAGTALASCTEFSYTHLGFATAMASNLLFSLRNTVTKKVQTPGSVASDSQVLFLLLSAFGVLLLLPLYATQGLLWGESPPPPSPSSTLHLLLAGVFHAIYNLSSFVILSRVSPVTHAVGNAMRRIFIIAVAIVVFANPVAPLNLLGSLAACFGVLLYTRAAQGQRAKAKSRKLPLDV